MLIDSTTDGLLKELIPSSNSNLNFHFPIIGASLLDVEDYENYDG